MANRIQKGDRLPFFRYDTPYSSSNRSRQLLAEHPPLVLVFMSNFGHPVTRAFADRYARTHKDLTAGSFALVVRSRPEKLADSIGADTLPYPLLCDAEGTLYDFLDIPRRSGTLTTYSLEGWNILRKARREGYRPPRDNIQQLPLTLILDADGTVLFCHYGETLTDVPADCSAIQKLLTALGLASGTGTVPAPADPADDTDSFIEAFRDAYTPAAPDIPVDVPVESPPVTKGPVSQDLSLDLPVAAPTGYQGDSVEFDTPLTVAEPEYQTLGSLTLPQSAREGKPRKSGRRRPVTRRYTPADPAPAPPAEASKPPEKDFSALLDELYNN